MTISVVTTFEADNNLVNPNTLHLTFPGPTFLSVGNFALITFMQKGNGNVSPNVPAGWTLLDRTGANQPSPYADCGVVWFYKFLTAADLSATLALTSNAPASGSWPGMMAQCDVFDGVDPLNPIDAYGRAAANGATAYNTSAWTVTPNAYIWDIAAMAETIGDGSVGISGTYLSALISHNPTTQMGIASINDGAQAIPGPTVNLTYTANASDTHAIWGYATVALKPAGGAVPKWSVGSVGI